MKRILLVLSAVLLVLCGCDFSMSAPETHLYVSIGNESVYNFDHYALRASKGNTSVIVDKISRGVNPVDLDTLTPGTWSIEVRAIKGDRVVGAGKETASISKGASVNCIVKIDPVYDYSYGTFKRTMEKISKDYPYSDDLEKKSYYSSLAFYMPNDTCYVKMSDSMLERFRRDMSADLESIHDADVALTITRNSHEFTIVMDSSNECLTILQSESGAWTFTYVDKTLPDDMKSYLDQLQIDSIAKIDGGISSIVFHDDYDRIRFIMDSLIGSLDTTSAFVGKLNEDYAQTMSNVLDIIINNLVNKVPDFADIPGFTVSISYRYTKITIDIDVLMYDGSNYTYTLEQNGSGEWNARRPDLPIWKPDQSVIDQSLDDTRKEFIDDLVNSTDEVPPATQGELIEDLMDKFTPHLPDYEFISSMDEDQRYLFEGEVAAIIRDAFDIMPGVPGVATDPTVTVNVDIDYVSFRFIIVIHLETGEFYTFRYQKNPDGTWTSSKEYDDGVRPDLAGVTYQDYKNNFSSNHSTAYNEVAPGPGYYDMSSMNRTPLFWQMSERQRLQFKKEAGDDGHVELSRLQQQWDKQTFVYDVRIVGNEFRRYYSFYLRSQDKLCQAVTIQHEDGTWEQRFVSEWIDLPSDSEITLAPSYDDVRQEIEVLKDDMIQKITTDLPSIELTSHEQKVGFLMDRFVASLPSSNKYNGLTDTQIAKLTKDLADVIAAGYGKLPVLPGIDLTFNVNIRIEVNVVVIEIHFVLPDGKEYTYTTKADGNDSWIIEAPEISLPVPAPDYDVILNDISGFENNIGSYLDRCEMEFPPRAESERVDYLLSMLPDNLPRIPSYKGLTEDQMVKFAGDFKAVLDRLISKVTPMVHATIEPGFTVELEFNLDILVMKVYVDIGDGNSYVYAFDYNGSYWAPASRPVFPPVSPDYDRISLDVANARTAVERFFIQDPMPSSYRFESERMGYLFNAIQVNMPVIDYRGITAEQIAQLSHDLEEILRDLNSTLAPLPGENSLSTQFNVEIEVEVNVLVIRFVVDIGDGSSYTYECRINGKVIRWTNPEYPEFCIITIKDTRDLDVVRNQVRWKKHSGFQIDDVYLGGLAPSQAVDVAYREYDRSHIYVPGEYATIDEDCTIIYSIYEKTAIPDSLLSSLDHTKFKGHDRVVELQHSIRLHDMYDRVRLVMDALYDTLESSYVYVRGLSQENEIVFERSFLEIIEYMFATVPPMELPTPMPEFVVDLYRWGADVGINIKITVDGKLYIYELYSDDYGRWRMVEPDLPVWKPSILDIDELLKGVKSAMDEEIAADQVTSFATERKRVEYISDKFSRNIKGDEIFEMFDADMMSHFETRVKEMLDNVVSFLPAANDSVGNVTVSVDVDRAGSVFSFKVKFMYGDDVCHIYTYELHGDYTFSVTSEYYDLANRPDVPGCTFADFQRNFSAHGRATEQYIAPGPGYWDHSELDKSPLFWTMSDRQLKQYAADSKTEHRHVGFSSSQLEWDHKTYIFDARIVGNEFFDYYSFYDSQLKRTCQAVTIQHEDGTWEQRFISEWTPVPSDSELSQTP